VKKRKSAPASPAPPAPETGEAVAATPEAASPVGSLPRTKKPVPAHIKAAVERAEARAAGKDPYALPPATEDVAVDPATARAIEAPRALPGEPAGHGPAVLAALDRVVEMPPDDHDDKPHDDLAVEADGSIRRGGRPTLYRPEFVEIVRQMAADDCTDEQIAKVLGVGLRTLERWKAEQMEFRRAFVMGERMMLENVKRAHYLRAVGFSVPSEVIKVKDGVVTRVKTLEYYPPDVTAQKNILANKDPENWQRDGEHQPQSGGGERQLTDLARRLALLFQMALGQKQAQPGDEAKMIEGEAA